MTRDRMVMPMTLFRQVLNSYIAIGGGDLSLTPVVGDIFMDPYLADRISLVREYKEHGIGMLSVTTNAVPASRYSDSELKPVVDAFDKILISVYGCDDREYELMTRHNSYQDMLTSVQKIMRVIDDKNKIRIGFRLLRDYTMQELSSWIQDNFGDAIPFEAVNVYANWGNMIEPRKLPLDGKWLPKVNNLTQCLIPILAVQVFSNGSISFCPCSDYNANEGLSLGHITDGDLLELYNSVKVRQLWNYELEMPVFCRHCSFHKSIKDIGEFSWLFERPVDFIGG
jgi:hypothetical protein